MKHFQYVKISIILVLSIALAAIFWVWNFEAVVYVEGDSIDQKYVAKSINFFENSQLNDNSVTVTLDNKVYQLVKNSPKISYNKISIFNSNITVDGFGDYKYLHGPKNTNKDLKEKNLKKGSTISIDPAKETFLSYINDEAIFILNDFIVKSHNYRSVILDISKRKVINSEGAFLLEKQDLITIKNFIEKPITYSKFEQMIVEEVFSNYIFADEIYNEIAAEKAKENNMNFPVPDVTKQTKIPDAITLNTLALSATDREVAIDNAEFFGEAVGYVKSGKIIIKHGIIIKEITLTNDQITAINAGGIAKKIIIGDLATDTNYNISFELLNLINSKINISTKVVNEINTKKEAPFGKYISFKDKFYDKNTYQTLTIFFDKNTDAASIVEVEINAERFVPVRITDTEYIVNYKIDSSASNEINDKRVRLTKFVYKNDSKNAESLSTEVVDLEYDYTVLKNTPQGNITDIIKGTDSISFKLNTIDPDNAIVKDSGLIEVQDSTGVVSPTITGYNPNIKGIQNITISGLKKAVNYRVNIKSKYNLANGKVVDFSLGSFAEIIYLEVPKMNISLGTINEEDATLSVTLFDPDNAINKATTKIDLINEATNSLVTTMPIVFDVNTKIVNLKNLIPGTKYRVVSTATYDIKDNIINTNKQLDSKLFTTIDVPNVISDINKSHKLNDTTYVTSLNNFMVNTGSTAPMSVNVKYTGYGNLANNFNQNILIDAQTPYMPTQPGKYEITYTKNLKFNSDVTKIKTMTMYVFSERNDTLNAGSFGISKPEEYVMLSDVVKLRSDINMHLVNDIDMQAYNNATILTTFKGIFDGQNKTISNWTSNQGGLFYRLDANSTKQVGVQNIYILNGTINVVTQVYGGSIGVIANYVDNGKKMVFKNIGVSGVAINDNAYEKDSVYTGTGGIIGRVTVAAVTVENSYFKGSIIAHNNNGISLGGLIGISRVSDISIKNSYAIATMTVAVDYNNTGTYLGGLFGGSDVGGIKTTIENSYFRGSFDYSGVFGTRIVGGIVGRLSSTANINFKDSVANSFSYITGYKGSLVPNGIVSYHQNTVFTNLKYYNKFSSTAGDGVSTPWTVTPNKIEVESVLNKNSYDTIVDNILPQLKDTDGNVMKHQTNLTFD